MTAGRLQPLPSAVAIHEVAPRDGLQAERTFLPTPQKIALIDALSRTGVAKIEATSFTSPRAIPALADGEAVMAGISRLPGVVYAALVPNARGCERALAAGVDEVNIVMSCSESHNRSNLRMERSASLDQISAIHSLAMGAAIVNVSLSTAFGCPYEGPVQAAEVLRLIERIGRFGIGQITLCDTTGMAQPAQVESLFLVALREFPDFRFTAHFHNTRGMGLANCLAALMAGVRHFDASLGGLGGCPFAPGATGNVVNEDLVHMLDAMGIETGVDLDALIDVARQLPALLGHDVPGQVMKAGRYDRQTAAAPDAAPSRRNVASGPVSPPSNPAFAAMAADSDRH
ncbi:MAG TPA: hydroxymethylglutaryl-CoA lyase [Hyphomicrobiaceae bacterium]